MDEFQKEGFSGEIFSSLDARTVGKHLQYFLKKYPEEKYLILFKGSQNTIFIEEALVPLLPSSEQKNLPRQSESWKKKKNEFFREISG